MKEETKKEEKKLEANDDVKKPETESTAASALGTPASAVASAPATNAETSVPSTTNGAPVPPPPGGSESQTSGLASNNQAPAQDANQASAQAPGQAPVQGQYGQYGNQYGNQQQYDQYGNQYGNQYGQYGQQNQNQYGQYGQQGQPGAPPAQGTNALGPPGPPGPPGGFGGPAPPSNLGRDSGKMFIGGLNWDTTEQGLVEYFSKFGEVVDHTIMRDSATGKSRGFGFLTFKDTKSVDAVIQGDHVLDGKLIDPKRAIAREEQDKVGKIFVGGIDPMVNEKEFHDFFSQFGSIIDAQLMTDKDTGRSRGFGFITFDSPEAVDRVTVNKFLTLKGKSMEVKRAEPRGAHHGGLQQQGYGYNPYNQYGGGAGGGAAPYGQYNQGVNGMNADMMQYWQQMQQWYMYQQQQQQLLQQDYQENPDQQPLNPQQQGENESAPTRSESNSTPPDVQKRLPRGPRRAPPSGPSGGHRGRGGYRGRDRGYHPYSRGGRR